MPEPSSAGALHAGAFAFRMLGRVHGFGVQAGRARIELRRWIDATDLIADGAARRRALEKLIPAVSGAELGCAFSLAAPRRQRGDLGASIVALQVLYDYLDALSEQGWHRDEPDERTACAPLASLFAAPGASCSPLGESCRRRAEDQFLAAIEQRAREGLRRLPSFDAVREDCFSLCTLCASGQALAHTQGEHREAELIDWARSEAARWQIGWRDLLLASATALLITYPLLCAAAHAEPIGDAERGALIACYLRICALLTLLDAVIDHDEDFRQGLGSLSVLRHYRGGAELAAELRRLAAESQMLIGNLRNRAHHERMLMGAVAYYTTEPGATSDFARPIIAELHAQLRPTITPALTLLRNWRAARQRSLTLPLPLSRPRFATHRAEQILLRAELAHSDRATT